MRGGMQNDTSNAEQVAGAEREALNQIVGKYNISEEDIKGKLPSAGSACQLWPGARTWLNVVHQVASLPLHCKAGAQAPNVCLCTQGVQQLLIPASKGFSVRPDTAACPGFPIAARPSAPSTPSIVRQLLPNNMVLQAWLLGSMPAEHI